MSQVAKTGTTTIDLDEVKPNGKPLGSYVYTKIGTCMPPSQDYGTVLAVSRFVAAYGLKGGNLRVVLTKGSATAMLNGHPTSIVDIAVAPETHMAGQSIFASLSAEGICRMWEISNQDAGGEIDARDTLNLKTKGEGAQRVFFHPGWAVGGGRNNQVFILHEGTVTGICYSRDVREEHAVDPTNGLSIEKFAAVRLQRDSKVLDMAFQKLPSSSVWRAATGHEDGTCCLWALSNLTNGKLDADDDGGSTYSMDSVSVASAEKAKRVSKPKEPSTIDAPPLMTIKVGSSPVITVGFASLSTLVAGCEHNAEISLWSLDSSKSSTSPLQRLILTRSSAPLKNFRSAFVKRNVDGASCVLLSEKGGQDAILIPLPVDKKGSSSLLSQLLSFRLSHPVLSLSAEYDIEKDKLVCHIVDTDSILDVEAPADVAFGSIAPQDVRQSMRRASKRAESMVANPDTGPVEWSDKPNCCIVS